jgi:glycosyltransferase involved in cell wall biosynthesis
MRRLAIFTSLPEVGGHTTTTIGLCELLRGYFDEVEVLCKTMPEHGLSPSAVTWLEGAGCRVTMLNAVTGGLNPVAVSRVVARYAARPATVFLTVGMRYLSAVLASAIRHELSVYYHITHDLNRRTVGMLSGFAKVFGKIVFISPATYVDFLAGRGTSPKVDWCLQGSDLGVEPVRRPDVERDTEHEVECGTPIRFGVLGRLTKPKGAAEILRFIDADAARCEILVAGTGEFADAFKARAGWTKGRSKVRVSYLGAFNAGNRLPFLRSFFERVDWLCVPTIDEWESISMVLLEALQHGVPVLINRTGGLRSFGMPHLGPPPSNVVRLVAPDEFLPAMTRIAEESARTDAGQCVAYYRRYFAKDIVAAQWERLLGIGRRGAKSHDRNG